MYTNAAMLFAVRQPEPISSGHTYIYGTEDGQKYEAQLVNHESARLNVTIYRTLQQVSQSPFGLLEFLAKVSYSAAVKATGIGLHDTGKGKYHERAC